MYTVKLMRRRDERVEEYGRVLLEGKTIRFQSLSTVFQAYLQRGIEDEQHHLHTPNDGIAFLKYLAHHHFGDALYATHVEEGPKAMTG